MPREAIPSTSAATVVTGTVEGVGWKGTSATVVATDDVLAFYRGDWLASETLTEEGPYELIISEPPEELYFWLVHSEGGATPSPTDPHILHNPIPRPTEGGEQVAIDLSSAHETLADKREPFSWTLWMADPGAAATALVFLLLTSVAYLFGLRWLRRGLARCHPERRGESAIDEGSHDDPDEAAQGGSALLAAGALTALLTLSLGLRALLMHEIGLGNIGVEEQPFYKLYLQIHEFSEGFHDAFGPDMLLRNHWPVLTYLLSFLGELPERGMVGVRTMLLGFSAGAVLATWALTKRVAGNGAALAACLLLAILPASVRAGATLSQHGLHLFFVALSTLLLFTALERGRLGWILAWALANIVGFFTLPLQLFYFGAQLLGALLVVLDRSAARHHRCGALRCLTWGLPITILTAPFLAQLALPFHRMNLARGLVVHKFGQRGLTETGALAATLEFVSGLPRGWAPAFLVALALMVLGVLEIRKRSRAAATILALSALTFPLVIAILRLLAASVRGASMDYTYHWHVGLLALVCPLMGAGMLAALRSGQGLWRRGGSGRGLALALFLTVLAPLTWMSWATGGLLGDPGVPDMVSAQRIILDEVHHGDVAIALTGTVHGESHMVSEAITNRARQAAAEEDEHRTLPWAREGRGAEHANAPFELTMSANRIRRLWALSYEEQRLGHAIVGHQRFNTWRKSWLDERFRVVERWQLRNLELMLLERDPQRFALTPLEGITLDDPVELFTSCSSCAAIADLRRQIGSITFRFPLRHPVEGIYDLRLDEGEAEANRCLQVIIAGCLATLQADEHWRTSTPCEATRRLHVELISHCAADRPIQELELGVSVPTEEPPP